MVEKCVGKVRRLAVDEWIEVVREGRKAGLRT